MNYRRRLRALAIAARLEQRLASYRRPPPALLAGCAYMRPITEGDVLPRLPPLFANLENLVRRRSGHPPIAWIAGLPFVLGGRPSGRPLFRLTDASPLFIRACLAGSPA